MASHAALNREHGYSNSLTLCRGCTLSPRVVSPVMPVLIKHLHTSRGVRLGSTTRPLQSISPLVHAYWGLTINLKAHLQLTPMESSKGSPFSPYLQVAHLSGDLLIIRPGHTHIGSWLHCEACSERTTNRSLYYLSKTFHKPLYRTTHCTFPTDHLLKHRIQITSKDQSRLTLMHKTINQSSLPKAHLV